MTSLVFDLFRDMDSMIQFWIQASFAVVVAVFAAGDRLSRWMRGMIAGLYLIASGPLLALVLASEPTTLDGLAAVDFASRWIHLGRRSMPLVRCDHEMRVQPWLAEPWEIDSRFAATSCGCRPRVAHCGDSLPASGGFACDTSPVPCGSPPP